jgi:hypothetical protein
MDLAVLRNMALGISLMGVSKNALFPRLLRGLVAPTFGSSVLESSCMTYTLRFSTRCFLTLSKKSLFLEAPKCYLN